MSLNKQKKCQTKKNRQLPRNKKDKKKGKRYKIKMYKTNHPNNLSRSNKEQ